MKNSFLDNKQLFNFVFDVKGHSVALKYCPEKSRQGIYVDGQKVAGKGAAEVDVVIAGEPLHLGFEAYSRSSAFYHLCCRLEVNHEHFAYQDVYYQHSYRYGLSSVARWFLAALLMLVCYLPLLGLALLIPEPDYPIALASFAGPLLGVYLAHCFNLLVPIPMEAEFSVEYEEDLPIRG